MTFLTKTRIACAASALALFTAQAALADATVAVSLWDKGPDSLMMDDAHMMKMGKMDSADMSTGTMGITVDQASIAAGKVTFNVTNDSKDIIHEMLVAPVSAGQVELPYDPTKNRVDEEGAKYLGEVSELDPGQTGSLTVDLTPGTYVLFCNIPGHFIDGMWTLITVN